jgi:hypothetical protein
VARSTVRREVERAHDDSGCPQGVTTSILAFIGGIFAIVAGLA